MKTLYPNSKIRSSILFLALFSLSLISGLFFNHLLDSSSLSTIQSGFYPKGSSSEVSLSYGISYDIQDDKPDSDEFFLFLNINGTNLIYENGTIAYQLSKTIDNEKVISKLSLLFGEEQTEFFSNYQDEDTLKTRFSYRREQTYESNANFSTNATYTIFWLNSSDRPANFLHDFQQIPFLRVSDPVMLTLRKEHPYVAAPYWSPELRDLRKNQPILPSYHLYLNLNDEINLKMYYDMTWSVLLRAEMEYINPDDESNRYNIRIYLDSSSLPLVYEEENPYWLEYRQQLLIFGGIGGGLVIFGVLTTTIILNKKRRKKSDHKVEKAQNLLDRI